MCNHLRVSGRICIWLVRGLHMDMAPALLATLEA